MNKFLNFLGLRDWVDFFLYAIFFTVVLGPLLLGFILTIYGYIILGAICICIQIFLYMILFLGNSI